MIVDENIDTYEKVENIKRPIELGEKFTVACLVKRDGNKIISFIPVINTPHTDKENGQPETHYHTDYRFVLTEETMINSYGYFVTDKRDGFKGAEKARVEEGIDGELEFHILPIVSENHNGLAQRFFIRNSRLKHKCIHKGRCPHRGYDLSQEKSVNGIITCPLHALEFDVESGKITDKILDELNSNRNREVEYKKQLSKGLKLIGKIKDGDVITQEEYNELYKYPLNTLYSIYQIPRGEYNCYEWTKERTNDFPSKPLENKTKLKFKVKLSNLELSNKSNLHNG